MGFGAMRLTEGPGGVPSDRERVIGVLAIAGDGREAGAASGRADGPAVLAAARAHGVSPAQIRLAWTLHQGPHLLAIPGTGDPAHLVENVAAGAVRLTPAEVAALDAEAAG